MMTTPKQSSSDILRALRFPSAGDVLGDTKVVSAKHNFLKGSILRYQIVFPKGTREKDIPSLLGPFFNTQMLEGEHNMIVKHHDYTVRPHEENVAVVGAMHIVPIALANPGAQEFDEDYSKMEMKNPETYFRKFDCKGFSGAQFRAKLFSLVSYMGENYGYCDDNHIYHRRASLVMPKIKITKAVKDAKTMYHTHPKKDEPSLSSADDYLLYFDLSHEPRNVRDFYTVMADRMDHFKITPKKGSKENYLKLSEDKFLDEVNAKMEELEVKWTKKIPKEGATTEDDLAFCEGITKDLVAWMNKKYGKMFTIKYKCYYKVRQNPPKLETQDLHLNDEFLKKALVEVSSEDYTWPGFKSDIQPHENYAYWHQRYYTEHVRDSYMTLGVDLFGNDNRRRDQYLEMRFGESSVSRLRALNILNLSYDISKADGKIRDGTGFMSRLEDLAEYLELSQDVYETLKLLEEVIHSGDVFSENAKTLSGDYYALVLLSFYSIQAVEIMKKVNAQEMNLEVAKFEVYNQLKAKVGGELSSFLREHIRLFENGFIAGGFHTASNPPVQLRSIEAYTQYPPEAFEWPELLRDAFDEPGNSFNPERTDLKKKMFGAKQVVLYVPTTEGRVTMMIYRSTGKAQIKGPSLEACAEAAKKVNQQLYKYGARGVKFDDEFDISEKMYATNPSKAQVITISGPSGSGKSSMIRGLLKMLPNSKTAPTITTRQKRKSDKPGERTFVTVEEFKKMANRGDLVGVQLQASGNYYARKKSDFENASYVLVDVSLKGVNDIKSAFPNTFSIFLEPVEDPEVIRQRLLRRGDISAKEAAGRASIIPSQIAASKKMNFDARIQTQQGKFDYAAQQAYELIPKKNPDHDSGKLTDLHMLAKYTVEELENDNDLPTIAECAAAVTKENYIGGGAFGRVFRVPGTDYLFKVNKRHDPNLFKELIKYLDGKSKTFTYPTEGVTRYRVDYRIPFECGQPRAWLRREGGGSEPDTIMKNLEGFTIGDKIPQSRFANTKDRFKAQQGKIPFYRAENIKEYFEWVEEISNIPQENLNETVRQMQYLISRGIPQDIHSYNMIYNPKTKKITITDWFWDEKAVGKSIITNAPTLTGIFERVSMPNWVKGMSEYFSIHKKKEVQNKHAAAFKKGVDKALKSHLKYFEKCLKAFEANNVRPSQTDYLDSFFYTYKRETEAYVDMIRRLLSEGKFLDFYYDFDEVQRADAVAISNPKAPKKQLVQGKLEQFGADLETKEEQEEREARLTENKKEIEEWNERLKQEIKEREERFKQTSLDIEENPKELFDWFEEWVGLVNMKNKELKAFIDSDWGKVAGLSKQEAADWNNIKSGRVSAQRIIKMRAKLGLTGPKDYIDPKKPRILEDYYEKALNNWTGPSDDALKGETDWDWCKRQVRFNKRASAFPYNPNAEEAKGPLVKEMKTYARPSRRLLSLWIWGHDPWRWARKNGFERMSPCPKVPWIGMTEKKKWGTIEVEMGPRKKNPSRRVPRDNFKKDFNPFGGKESRKKVQERQIANLDFKGDPPRYKLQNGEYFFADFTRSPTIVVTTHFIYRYFMRKTSHVGESAKAVHEAMKSLKQDGFGELQPRTEENDKMFRQGLNIIRAANYLKGNPLAQRIEDKSRNYIHLTTYLTRNPSEELENPPTIIGTGSPKKVAEYQALLGDGYTYDDQYDLPEVVGDPKTVIIHKAALAYKVWGKPVIVEDTTLHIEGMSLEDASNIKWMVDDLPDHVGKKAVERVSIAYADGVNVYAYVGRTDGKLVTRRGTKGFAHDFYFMPKGSTKTYAEEKKVSSRTKAIKKFVADKPDFAVDMPKDWTGAWQENYTPEDMFTKNPSKTPEGRKIPKRYLKGLNKEEMIIAAKEIDKGHKYDINDPKAYEFWKSDIKATARGYKTVPSKYKSKFIRMYGPLPEEGTFIEKMSKATGIKKSILQKVYDKGLAAWRGGHRPGVQQHQWAAGRVYSFVTLGNTVKKGNKKMPDYSLAVKAGLVKENPKEVDAYVLVNGSRQGAINWMRDNKWEYGFDDEAINIVEEDERIPTRLVQWFVREASKGNIDLYEDTEQALSNWEFLKDKMGDQTVVNHIKEEYGIKSPKNPLLYSSGDLNGIANWYHSLFEKPPLPDEYQALLKYTEENYLPPPVGGRDGPQWHEWRDFWDENGGEPSFSASKGGAHLVGQTSEWVVIKLTKVNATVAFARLRNNSWCVKDPQYAARYLYDRDEPSAAEAERQAYDDWVRLDEGRVTEDELEAERERRARKTGGPLYLILKPSGAYYALFHYPTQSFLNIDDEPFPIPASLDELMEEVTGISVLGAIHSDSKAAYDYALELGQRFKEGEEAILTSPIHAYYYARDVLERRWPRAESVIATNGEYAARYAMYVVKKRWTEFADTVTAQIAEGVISIDPRAAANYAEKLFDGRWKAAEATILTEPYAALNYARYVIKGPWPEAEKVIATDGADSYRYATEALKGRFELGESEMFGKRDLFGRKSSNGKPPLSPEEAITYAQLVKERIPELEKAIIGEAWGSNISSRYARYEGMETIYQTHGALAMHYVITLDVGRIPELEEVIAQDVVASFAYANHFDRPFPRGEEVILSVKHPSADKAGEWAPGAVAAAYEDKFYNGNWPRLRRKLEEYKKIHPGDDSLEALFGTDEGNFIRRYYQAKGLDTRKKGGRKRDNPNIKDSEIHGQGLFADENISKGETVVTEPADVKYINHSDSPNLTARYLPDETLEYVAKVDINQGSELTLDYRQLATLTGHPEAKSEVSPETLYNPSEWRHGEFAEEDPFEEYF